MAATPSDPVRKLGQSVCAYLHLCPLRARHGWRIWIALAGAIVMGLAGVLAGQAVGMDELAAPRLNGPRLRVTPIALVTSGSPSRDHPSTGAIV